MNGIILDQKEINVAQPSLLSNFKIYANILFEYIGLRQYTMLDMHTD
jgi:hypothetical protein